MAKGARKPRSPKRQPRQERHIKVLICTEGAVTEPQYFEGISKPIQEIYHVTLDVIPGQHSDPVKVVEKCMEKREERENSKKNQDFPYVRCFAVVDVDHWDNPIKGKLSRLRQAILLAKENDINVLVSNIKFEVWLLWHKNTYNKSLDSKSLDRHCKNKDNKILKEGKNIVPDFPFQNWEEACKRANQHGRVKANSIGRNPSSALPRLFEALKALADQQKQQ
jgi:hypothetical protein